MKWRWIGPLLTLVASSAVASKEGANKAPSSANSTVQLSASDRAMLEVYHYIAMGGEVTGEIVKANVDEHQLRERLPLISRAPRLAKESVSLSELADAASVWTLGCPTLTLSVAQNNRVRRDCDPIETAVSLRSLVELSHAGAKDKGSRSNVVSRISRDTLSRLPNAWLMNNWPAEDDAFYDERVGSADPRAVVGLFWQSIDPSASQAPDENLVTTLALVTDASLSLWAAYQGTMLIAFANNVSSAARMEFENKEVAEAKELSDAPGIPVELTRLRHQSCERLRSRLQQFSISGVPNTVLSALVLTSQVSLFGGQNVPVCWIEDDSLVRTAVLAIPDERFDSLPPSLKWPIAQGTGALVSRIFERSVLNRSVVNPELTRLLVDSTVDLSHRWRRWAEGGATIDPRSEPPLTGRILSNSLQLFLKMEGDEKEYLPRVDRDLPTLVEAIYQLEVMEGANWKRIDDLAKGTASQAGVTRSFWDRFPIDAESLPVHQNAWCFSGEWEEDVVRAIKPIANTSVFTHCSQSIPKTSSSTSVAKTGRKVAKAAVSNPGKRSVSISMAALYSFPQAAEKVRNDVEAFQSPTIGSSRAQTPSISNFYFANAQVNRVCPQFFKPRREDVDACGGPTDRNRIVVALHQDRIAQSWMNHARDKEELREMLVGSARQVWSECAAENLNESGLTDFGKLLGDFDPNSCSNAQSPLRAVPDLTTRCRRTVLVPTGLSPHIQKLDPNVPQLMESSGNLAVSDIALELVRDYTSRPYDSPWSIDFQCSPWIIHHGGVPHLLTRLTKGAEYSLYGKANSEKVKVDTENGRSPLVFNNPARDGYPPDYALDQRMVAKTYYGVKSSVVRPSRTDTISASVAGERCGRDSRGTAVDLGRWRSFAICVELPSTFEMDKPEEANLELIPMGYHQTADTDTAPLPINVQAVTEVTIDGNQWWEIIFGNYAPGSAGFEAPPCGGSLLIRATDSNTSAVHQLYLSADYFVRDPAQCKD
jgi:hypothetical protein